MTTTTLTNASLADAVALFLSTDPEPVPTSASLNARPVTPRGHHATQPGRPVVVPLFQSRDTDFDAEITSAFDLLERGTG